MSEILFGFGLGCTVTWLTLYLVGQWLTGDMDETPDERERMEARLHELDALSDGWGSERFPLPMRPRVRRTR